MKYTRITNNENLKDKSRRFQFAFFLLISVILFGCKSKNNDADRKKSHNEITYNYNDHEFSFKFHESDYLTTMNWLNDDSKNGNSWEFYPNGNIKSKYSYQKGIIVNEAYEYHISGSLSAYKFFDTMGRLAYLRSYAEDGSFDKETGVLITYDEDAIAVHNDTLILFIHMPEPPGTKVSSVVVFEDSSLNPLDSTSFEMAHFEVKIAVNKVTHLFVKAQLNEKDVFTCNDKRISISALLENTPRLN